MKFIEFFGAAHLNDCNVSAHANKSGCLLVAEDLVKGEIIGRKRFDTYEEAVDWFSSLPGINNISRLANALEALTDE